MKVIPASIASFLLAIAMLMSLRPFANVLGLVDIPGGRKTHRGDIPVVGGLAMFAAFAVAAIGGGGLGHAGISILAVAAFIVALGTLDDLFNLPSRVRLFAHLSAAVAIVYGSGFTVPDLGDLVGLGNVRLGWLSLPFTVVSIVALINAFNMLDGLDGLAGSAGLVALAGVMILASMNGAAMVVLVSGSMLGAVAAFLLFNLPVKSNRTLRIFMGDAGSTLLGFLLAALPLILVQPQVDLSPVVVLWLMPVPIFELFSTTGRRLVGGISPTTPDTNHFHHRLISAGFSVRAICALYLLLSVSSCAFGIWAYRHGVPDVILSAGFCLTFGIWLLLVRNARHFTAALPRWCRAELSAGH